MLESIFIGVGGIVLMMALWIVVQTLWRKTFSDLIEDDDVLAGRTDCGNCGCLTSCRKNGEGVSLENHTY